MTILIFLITGLIIFIRLAYLSVMAARRMPTRKSIDFWMLAADGVFYTFMSLWAIYAITEW